MQRRILGGTGISVSEFALGAMMFGAWGNTDHDDCVRIIHRALDAGINVVDTADVYAGGESEEIVGKALKGRREDVVLATKFFNPMGPDANHGGNSRRWIVRAVEDSLRRLGTDHIDLYQVHRPDPATDIDETLSALSDLVRSGKVRAIGTSTFPAEQLVEAQWTAERRGHVRFRTEQPPYSMLARGIEGSVLPTAQKKVAAEAGLTLPHLATAFVRSHPAVTSVIIGPRTGDQLESLLEGAGTTLDAATLDRIDAIVPPGTDLNRADLYYLPPSLTQPSLRRR
ncbi:aldo/keto reductase [Streptomyces lydicus]|uniref:aldo/keto reductase n=1 Tax=Streptomyces lydicus TaxID=47763 RepID=UPI0037D7E653